ncbi:MAG TPA: acyl-CoA dehydrogenase family protein [Acidimicrobiales bacterium]|nr:acyl-CoA dehydrogenase family protein [Acidimicrobiales bacterium]
MDFRLGPASEAVRERIRSFLDEHMTGELEERIYRTGVLHDADFSRALAEGGWLAPGWPVEYGGQGLDPLEMLAVAEELRRADAPTYGIGTTMMASTVIRQVGTEEQKAAILPRALSGEIVIVLGFTEPGVGSDLAAVTTRAVRDGDEWVINGQKMFTTNAHIGDYAFLLARTNAGGAKHEGLTMFLVPMHQAGVEVQAVYTLSGERTNITFLNDVRVPDAWRIGEVDKGWSTMTVALATEHQAGFSAAIARLLETAEAWAAEATDDEGESRLSDPDVRDALARTAIDLEVASLLQRRTFWMAEKQLPMTTEGPMSKLFSSESLKARAEEIVEVVGPDGLRSYFEPTAPVNGLIEHCLRHSVGTTIYAGTSEIHRNMIAQRGLGLPRSR